MYKYMKALWKKPSENIGEIQKSRLVQWRTEPVVMKLERPTRIDRARSLGYTAKQGVIVSRVRINRGGRKTPDMPGGRRPMRSGRFFTLNKSKQQVAEEKAARKYMNMEVINSYWAGEDGKYIWYEVILADRTHPSVKSNKSLRDATSRRGKVTRGLTSSGRKSRGLQHKGKKG